MSADAGSRWKARDLDYKHTHTHTHTHTKSYPKSPCSKYTHTHQKSFLTKPERESGGSLCMSGMLCHRRTHTHTHTHTHARTHAHTHTMWQWWVRPTKLQKEIESVSFSPCGSCSMTHNDSAQVCVYVCEVCCTSVAPAAVQLCTTRGHSRPSRGVFTVSGSSFISCLLVILILWLKMWSGKFLICPLQCRSDVFYCPTSSAVVNESLRLKVESWECSFISLSSRIQSFKCVQLKSKPSSAEKLSVVFHERVLKLS